jgi:hypothetical protein
MLVSSSSYALVATLSYLRPASLAKDTRRGSSGCSCFQFLAVARSTKSCLIGCLFFISVSGDTSCDILISTASCPLAKSCFSAARCCSSASSLLASNRQNTLRHQHLRHPIVQRIAPQQRVHKHFWRHHILNRIAPSCIISGDKICVNIISFSILLLVRYFRPAPYDLLHVCSLRAQDVFAFRQQHRLSTPVLDGLESKSVQGDRDLRTDSYLPHAMSHARYDPTYLLLRSLCQRTAFCPSN